MKSEQKNKLREFLTRHGVRSAILEDGETGFFAKDIGLVCGYSGSCAKTCVKNFFPDENCVDTKRRYYTQSVPNPKRGGYPNLRVMVNCEQAVEFINHSKKEKARMLALEIKALFESEKG